jgi:hypothetical protein
VPSMSPYPDQGRSTHTETLRGTSCQICSRTRGCSQKRCGSFLSGLRSTDRPIGRDWWLTIHSGPATSIFSLWRPTEVVSAITGRDARHQLVCARGLRSPMAAGHPTSEEHALREVHFCLEHGWGGCDRNRSHCTEDIAMALAE